jgi:hypothetical protein
MLDIGNLTACIEDVRRATLDRDAGPTDPTDYYNLRGRLESSRNKLPPLYREQVFKPYVQTLDRLGSSGFTLTLMRDPSKEREAGAMLDIAHAILQNGERYEETATDAFQEVISDLYDGFLSEEDRTGVKPPDLCVCAPLVKWGRPDFGPYTWTSESLSALFNVKTPVVNLPPANAKSGLLAWAALGHETGGHDILHADIGLLAELADLVREALTNAGLGNGLPEYWADRIDETASDVLGILNMGPAAAIGLIGYFRGLNAAYTGTATLRNEGSASDPHPADIVRGYLAAETVRLLSFAEANAWGDLLDRETDKDLQQIRLAGRNVSAAEAKQSAKIVAQTLVRGKVEALEKHALGDIQDWHDEDEQIADQLRLGLVTLRSLEPIPKEFYAAHAIAAAVIAAVATDGDIPVIFERAIAILKQMHDRNPSWGPLYVAHPGDILRCVAYQFA